MHNKSYSFIVFSRKVRVLEFFCRDEMTNAISDLGKQSIPVNAFRFDHQLQEWVVIKII
jgi:hypothetical protein